MHLSTHSHKKGSEKEAQINRQRSETFPKNASNKDLGMDVSMNMDTDTERDMDIDMDMTMDASQHPLA